MTGMHDVADDDAVSTDSSRWTSRFVSVVAVRFDRPTSDRHDLAATLGDPNKSMNPASEAVRREREEEWR